MTIDTVFDLASITKALCTAPAILLLAEQKKLKLRDRVSKYLPAFAQKGKEAITLEQLLLHTSGLPADNALADYDGGREQALSRIYALSLDAAPGARFEYSDVGFILLGAIVEQVSGQPLDAFARAHFFEPLAMKDTGFLPSAPLAGRAAPTEVQNGALLQGRVHDPRASRLGGVAGHAGLFSTAPDLARFAQMLLGGGALDGTRVLAEDSIAQMTRPRPLPGGGSRGLGWDIDSKLSGNRGALRGGYGHSGFTGPSLWIEPSHGIAVIVLSSRLYPDGKGDARRLRREIATHVAQTLGPPTPSRAPAGAPPPGRDPSRPLLTGLDVLAREGFARLRGRRVGLVTHAAAVDRGGQSTLDRLRSAPGVELVALFSPEHGLRAEKDQPLPDGRDEASGLPLYSLYGERARPSEASIRGLDTLVFDLQDAGARFYTYTSTLYHLLETASKYHLRLIVLDRPNPLGGLRVEGPMLDPDRLSFTGIHPLPVRHGMTVGELARLFDDERSLGAQLSVVPMEGWSRDEEWESTGLLWRPPSPNLRSPLEARLYPGVALLETTNLSVGRGTARPFEQIGAPWLDGARLARALEEAHLPGVHFTPTTFTPASHVFAGEACKGVAIHLDDPRRFDPLLTGVTLAVALKRTHPLAWQSKGLLTLLGNREAFLAIERGESAERVVAGWQRDLSAFRARREKYLLYPSRP